MTATTTVKSSVVRFINGLRRRKTVMNAGTYVGGSFLRRALSFLLIPVYTRYMDPADFGIVGLALAVGSVVGLITSFGTRSAFARNYFDHRDDEAELRSYVTTTFIFVVAVGGLITLVLVLFGEPIWNLFSSGSVPFRPYIQLVLASAFAAHLLEIPVTLYRTEQKARQYTIANLATTFLRLGAIIALVVFLGQGARGQLLGNLLGNGIMAIVLGGLLLYRYASSKLNTEYVRKNLSYGLPLLPHLVAAWALAAADRLILEGQVSLEALGIYVLAYSLGMVMSVLLNSINKAYSPYYFDMVKRTRELSFHRRNVSYFVAGIGGICLAGALFTQEIVVFLTPARYYPTIQYVPLILFAYLLSGYYFMAVKPLYYHKKTVTLSKTTAFSAIVNVTLVVLLAPLIGIWGAVWATVIAYASTFVLVFRIGQRLERIEYPLLRLGLVTGAVFVGVLFASAVPFKQITVWSILAKLAILAAFAVLAYLLLIVPLGVSIRGLLARRSSEESAEIYAK